jgi:putative peptidoglycan lipid II flippase
MLAFSLLNAFFNFLKSVIIASRYGASSLSDSYYASVNIVNAPAGLVQDSLTALVLPRYQHHREQGSEDDYLASYASVVLLLFVCLAVFFALAGPSIARIVLAGFQGETLRTVDRLLLLTLPVIVFTPLTIVLDGALRSERFFIFGSLGGVVNSITLIGLLLLMKGDVSGIVIATSVGAAANFAVMLAVMVGKKKLGGKISLALGFREARIALPLVIGGGLGIVASYAEKSIASFLDTGTMTVLNMSSSLLGVASSILVGSLISVYYPFISSAVVSGDNQSYAAHNEESRRLVFGIFGLASTCMIAFAYPLFSFVYGRGAFSQDSVALLARIFSSSSFLLVYYALVNLANFVFYAKADSRTTVIINALTSYALGVSLQFALSFVFGAVGLIIGLSLGNLANLLVKREVMRKRYNLLLFRGGDSLVLFAILGLSLVFGFLPWTLWHLSLPVLYYLGISYGCYNLSPGKMIDYLTKRS